MPARDYYHDVVRNAIQKDGWTITHDPYRLKLARGKNLFVDLGAERLIAAEKGLAKIAIEIKEFRNQSPIVDLEQAVGQYVIYQLLLKETDPGREIYLAIPNYAYNEIFREPLGKLIIENLPLKLIVVELKTRDVKEWIPKRPPEKY